MTEIPKIIVTDAESAVLARNVSPGHMRLRSLGSSISTIGSNDSDIKLEDEEEEEEDAGPAPKTAMQTLLESIAEYFAETSVHGPKYITHEGCDLWEKLLWSILVCFGLTMAGVIFSQSIVAWRDSPMVINVGSTGVPVRTLDFPAVTVCQDNNADKVDRWYFIESLLNVVDDQCQYYGELGYPKPAVCSHLRTVFSTVWNTVANDALKELFDNSDITSASAELHRQLMQALTPSKQQLVTMMELIAFLGDASNLQKIINNYQQLLGKENVKIDKLESKVEVEFGAISPDSQVECYDYPDCWYYFTQFYRQILLSDSSEAPIGPLGTFITHFATRLQGSFRYNSQWLLSNASIETYPNEANVVHTFLQRLSGSVSNIFTSMLDIPSLLSLSQPFNSPAEREAKWNGQPVFSTGPNAVTNCTQQDFTTYAGYWKSYQSNQYAGNLQCPAENTCCNNWPRRFGREFEYIMLIMKYSQLHGKTSDEANEYTNDFGSGSYLPLLRALGFNSTKLTDLEKFRNTRPSLILSCAYGAEELVNLENALSTGSKEPLPGCSSFDPMWTNRGICQTFNAVSSRYIAKPNFYSETFTKTFSPKIDNFIQPITGSGQQYGLHIILDANNLGRPYSQPSSSSPTQFHLGLSNMFSPFDVRGDPLRVVTGTLTRVRISPEFTTSADGLQQSLSIDARQCRYHDESETLKIFANYTQAACRFECTLTYAHEQCGCTPWNYPYSTSGEMQICDLFGNACFSDLMSDVSYGERCDCPADCEAVQFTKFETNEALSASDLCSDPDSWVYKHLGARKRNQEGYKYRSSILKVLEHTYENQTTLDRLDCEHFVKYDVAIVTFELATAVYAETVRDVATTVFAQFGVLGGNLGFFTGMSVLSMVELVFWMRRIIFDVIATLQMKAIRNKDNI